MNRKKRNKNFIFKINEDEWNTIQKRLEICKVSSMSELFSHMMIHGIYLEYDHEELKTKLARQSELDRQLNLDNKENLLGKDNVKSFELETESDRQKLNSHNSTQKKDIKSYDLEL